MKDSKGQPANALEMSARDMARVGLVVMADGKWADKTLVPSSYLATALAPSQTLNPSYGLLFWLNGQSSALLPPSKPVAGMLMPSAPADVVAALGAADQKIYVSKSKRLVVTRQGAKASEGAQALSTWDDDLWKRIMAAVR
jgi:CubicO group peptidase (beta-lactamase class C family)